MTTISNATENNQTDHRHRRHHDNSICLPIFVWFMINKDHAVQLEPMETIYMADTLHIDQIDNLSIVANDAKLNVVPFTPDSPPVWTNSNPAAAGLVASTDGLTAVLTPLTVGVTTVGVSLSVTDPETGISTTFSASDDISIVAGPIASISIVATPAPIPVPPPVPTPGPVPTPAARAATAYRKPGGSI